MFHCGLLVAYVIMTLQDTKGNSLLCLRRQVAVEKRNPSVSSHKQGVIPWLVNTSAQSVSNQMSVGIPPQPASPQSMGQPPVGSSPATGPVPNKGLEAAALAKLGLVVRLLESLVSPLGAGTEAGKDVLKALTSLSKHVPPGAVSPGIEQTSMMKLMTDQKQQAPQIAAMRAAMAGGQPGAPGAGAAPAPSPAAQAE